ncbi:MAG: hypothetical protein OXI26_03650 [bacterium]|nr:hypothetical protein [bacterium]
MRRLCRITIAVGIAGLLGLFANSAAWAHDEDHEGPAFEVQVLRDPVAGWNILIVTDVRFAPENVSTGNVEGEGHAHVYVDGVKVSRIYGMWHYLNDLEPGEHEIRIELSNNDHTPITTGEHVLEQIVTIQEPVPTERPVTPEPRAVPADQPIPAVGAEAVHDPAGGFNLRIALEHFDLAPVKASRDPVDGEGHGRLYLNGEYVTRIYEEWTQITGLEVGQHEITVALVANDHAPLTHDGSPIAATFTLDVTEESLTAGPGHDHGGTADGLGDMDMGGGEHEHADDMDMGGMGGMGGDEPTKDMATG